MRCYIYILYNVVHDKFYIGQTYSLSKRIVEHQTGKGQYTSRYSGDWKFVYYESYQSRAEAMRRERQLKRLKSKEYLKRFVKEKRMSASSSVG